MKTSHVSGASSVETTRMSAAYAALLEEIEGVDGSELVHINVDIPMAVTIALGALPAIQALRPQIKAELKSVDLVQLDKLETYVLALFHAHTLYVTANRPAESLTELVEAATRMRDILYSDAMALVTRGMLDGAPLRDVKTGPGYRQLALDLTAVSSMMTSNWDQIKVRTAVLRAELAEAVDLAERLLKAVGQREQGPAVVADSAAKRQRVFTLFVRVYDQARRAVTFLRWDEGDMETITPSLYTGRSGATRRKSDEAESGETPAAAAPRKPSGTLPPVPTSAQPATDGASAPANAVEVGMPGSAPFVAA